jgi:hypothetical protein
MAAPILTRVWQEREYRIDVCRFSCGARIEHIWLSKILLQYAYGYEQFH